MARLESQDAKASGSPRSSLRYVFSPAIASPQWLHLPGVFIIDGPDDASRSPNSVAIRSPQLRRVASGLRRYSQRFRVEWGYFRLPVVTSELRKRWVVFKNPRAIIRFGRGTYLGPGFTLHMPYGGTFITGERVQFRRNFRAELGGPESRIELGADAVCTYDVSMQCTTVISLGARTILAQSTMVVDGNHRFRDVNRPLLEQGYDYRPIKIGDDALVNSKCTVIANIGTRSVIGANAVVTRDVPSYCVAVGIPARVVDYFGPPGEAPPDFAGDVQNSSVLEGASQAHRLRES